jgi:hypothetical protein
MIVHGLGPDGTDLRPGPGTGCRLTSWLGNFLLDQLDVLVSPFKPGGYDLGAFSWALWLHQDKVEHAGATGATCGTPSPFPPSWRKRDFPD